MQVYKYSMSRSINEKDCTAFWGIFSEDGWRDCIIHLHHYVHAANNQMMDIIQIRPVNHRLSFVETADDSCFVRWRRS